MQSLVTASCVVFIFNASLRSWIALQNDDSYTKRSFRLPYIGLEYAWHAMLTLISTIATGWYNSKIALLVLCGTDCRLLWESCGNAQELFNRQTLTKSLIRLLEKAEKNKEPLISFALTKACCIIHAQTKRISSRFQSEGSKDSIVSLPINTISRIIFLDVGVCSYVDQYTYLANIGLAAQEQRVCIDVCDIGTRPVTVLMQLVSLTKGIYLNFSSCIFEQLSEDRVKGTSSIHQSLGQDFENDKKTLGRLFVSFLLFHYSVPPETRGAFPTAFTTVENCSAVCRCHQQPVEIGLVCSCCLAVFCYEYKDSNCSVCRVRFKRERNVTVATARLAKKNLPSSSVIPKTPSIEKQL